MPITFTIDNQNPQTLALVEFLKTLSFVKFTETATPIAKTTMSTPSVEDLEEDEYGVPIKYRDKIMELSRKTNKAIAKRWDEALAKRNETVKI